MSRRFGGGGFVLFCFNVAVRLAACDVVFVDVFVANAVGVDLLLLLLLLLLLAVGLCCSENKILYIIKYNLPVIEDAFRVLFVCPAYIICHTNISLFFPCVCKCMSSFFVALSVIICKGSKKLPNTINYSHRSLLLLLYIPLVFERFSTPCFIELLLYVKRIECFM